MRRALSIFAGVALVAAVALAQYGGSSKQAAGNPDFAITASYIEACSCDMFCPCYFNDHATQHGDRHFCEASLVLKVDKGHYKDVNLDGVIAWVATDLGHEWARGKGDWLAVTFRQGITDPQKSAMLDILTQLYPMQFSVLGVDTAPIEWRIDEAKGEAVARIGDGSKGEVILDRWKGSDPKKETVMHNVQYWTANSNTGFRMWKNRRHYYNHFGKQFEHKGTNGFLITINFSGQAKAKAAD